MLLKEESVRFWLEQIRKFWSIYQWLGECFVLDHFVEQHWNKLPLSWRHFLDGLTPSELSDWICSGKLPTSRKSPPPLSLISLRVTIQVLSLNRAWRIREEGADSVDQQLKKLLIKHVKPKKRHEIEEMSRLVMSLSKTCDDLKNVMDIGAGLGHLCRFMTYGLGYNTVGLDGNAYLGSQASEFNIEVEKELKKKNAEVPVDVDSITSHHENRFLQPNDVIPGVMEDQYGLIGLHGCGDLGGVIIQNFVDNDHARFLAFVSCCYMKIEKTYPLSSFLKPNPIDLKYIPLELACHANEAYMNRLNDPDQVEKLKTHCYRAALETIVQKYGFVHEGLSIKSMKNYHKMDFSDYAIRSTERLGIRPTDEELSSPSIKSMLEHWMQVVYFYTLRVMIAPAIETAVLLDRALFILERGYECELEPIFDPTISPRNIVLAATKPRLVSKP